MHVCRIFELGPYRKFLLSGIWPGQQSFRTIGAEVHLLDDKSFETLLGTNTEKEQSTRVLTIERHHSQHNGHSQHV